jgi:hypothetical protein
MDKEKAQGIAIRPKVRGPGLKEKNKNERLIG